MATKIIAVLKQDGSSKMAGGSIWNAPFSPLFEIVDGPHSGKRGPDYQIFDLVGQIKVDETQISVYETGQLVSN